MKLSLINQIRDAIRRCINHELDAMGALYRIDTLLGEIDGRFEMDYTDHVDASVVAVYGDGDST
ncbi:MAG TPA: hypothetical protein PKK10_11615 [Woeseiaceae bacterium]|nr:hypothetical protein [Woeseiaceae bacterium]